MMEQISYGSLFDVNAALKAAGLKPIATVKYVCYSPGGSRRVVYDYATVDDEPRLVSKRRAAGWRVYRWVLSQCGIDSLNLRGWGHYSCIDDKFICRNPDATIEEHRALCSR